MFTETRILAWSWRLWEIYDILIGHDYGPLTKNNLNKEI